MGKQKVYVTMFSYVGEQWEEHIIDNTSIYAKVFQSYKTNYHTCSCII